MRQDRVIAFALAFLTACAIAETKAPPEPTVEYQPCSGSSSGDSEGSDPFSVLSEIRPDLEPELWGGEWKEGDEAHVGLVDVGAIDWDVACPMIGDPGLVVHEVPFTLVDLEEWGEAIAGKISSADDPRSFSASLTIDAGQYVVEIRAVTVEEAAGVAGDMPIDAWAYGGQASSGSWRRPID